MSSMPNDCINTVSEGGYNCTPIGLIEAARTVLGGIELDIASTETANSRIKADRFYSAEDCAWEKPEWKALTAFLNAPGNVKVRGKTIKATQWYDRLHREWFDGNIRSAIALVYRMTTLGSLNQFALRSGLLCIMNGDVAGHHGVHFVNGSGRLDFEIEQNGKFTPFTRNTQASAAILYARDPEVKERFFEEFGRFGIVFNRHSHWG